MKELLEGLLHRDPKKRLTEYEEVKKRIGEYERELGLGGVADKLIGLRMEDTEFDISQLVEI